MKRVLLLLLLVGLVSLALAHSLFAQEVTIRYANWLTADEQEVEEAVLEEFARLNPDIKIGFEPMPWEDYTRVMITKFAAGTAPEVLNISKLSQWANLGELLALDDFVTQDSSLDMGDFFPLVVDNGRFDGVRAGQGPLYGIPLNAGCYVLFYNKEMFDEYGVSYPDGTWDWDRLIEEALKFNEDRDGDGVFDQYGLMMTNIWDPQFLDLMMRAFGTTLWSEDTKSCNAGTEIGLQAIDFISDWANKYHIMPKYAERTVELVFEYGNIAIDFFHTYKISIFTKKANFGWDITPLPYGPAGFNGSVAMGHPIGINADIDEDKMDAAWSLIKFLTSKQAQIMRLDLNIPPSRRSVTESEQFKGMPITGQILVDSLENGYVNPDFPKAEEAWEMLHGAYDKVVLSGKTAEKYIPRAVKKVDKVLTRED